MKLRNVFLLALVILPIGALAQENSFSETQLSSQGQNAFQTLLSAPRFEDSHVGYGGDLSKFVAAYRVLLKEEKSVEAFKVLLEKATIAGQLYALSGLYDTDYKFFLSVIGKYKNSEDSVNTLSGCMGLERSVRDLVFLDKPNTVRLSSQTQSFDEWREKAKLGANDGFLIDISGGGYPMMFRGRSEDR